MGDIIVRAAAPAVAVHAVADIDTDVPVPPGRGPVDTDDIPGEGLLGRDFHTVRPVADILCEFVGRSFKMDAELIKDRPDEAGAVRADPGVEALRAPDIGEDPDELHREIRDRVPGASVLRERAGEHLAELRVIKVVVFMCQFDIFLIPRVMFDRRMGVKAPEPGRVHVVP